MSISDTQKRKRGRPAVGSVQVQVRIPPDQLSKLDEWMKANVPEGTSRPEVIRALTMAGIEILEGKEDLIRSLAAALERGDVNGALALLGIDTSRLPNAD